MPNPTANRGEWSELYAIGYLIVNGGGHAADEFTNRDSTLFYKVLEIVDNPSGLSETIYRLGSSDVEIFQNGVAVITLDKENVAQKVTTFFNDLLRQSSSHAFSLPAGEHLMEFIKKDRLSASSALTADLHLVLEDLDSGQPTPRRGFSIKSEIGSPATVFNASHSTNLTYKIVGTGAIPSFADVNSVKTNIKSLVNSGFRLEFVRFDNPIFERSLENIDSNLPLYLSQVLLAYMHSRTTKMKKVCEISFPASDPNSDVKIQKIKKFLSAASMGLKAATQWSGYPEDFGGMLLVKRNGDVLFYYLYNLKKFEEYLFRSLRFETPLAERHGFGEVYKIGNENFIKLNLQIRY
jgi:HpaII restriction endonuclease